MDNLDQISSYHLWHFAATSLLYPFKTLSSNFTKKMLKILSNINEKTLNGYNNDIAAKSPDPRTSDSYRRETDKVTHKKRWLH